MILKGNNKYLKNYDIDQDSYLMCFDKKNLSGKEMSLKLLMGRFEWIENICDFTKNSESNTMFLPCKKLK